MRPLSSTELPGLEFSSKEPLSHKMRMPTNKIGWVHSFSDKPETRFDLVIKDALGRVIVRKENCGGNSKRYGELLNKEIGIGNEIEVRAENIRGGEKVLIFIN